MCIFVGYQYAVGSVSLINSPREGERSILMCGVRLMGNPAKDSANGVRLYALALLAKRARRLSLNFLVLG